MLTSISAGAPPKTAFLSPPWSFRAKAPRSAVLKAQKSVSSTPATPPSTFWEALKMILGHTLRIDPRLFPGGDEGLGEGLLQAGAAVLQKGFDRGDDLLRLGRVLGFHRPGGDPLRKIADLIQGGHRPLEDQPQQGLHGQGVLILAADAQLVRIPEGMADARPLEAIPAAQSRFTETALGKLSLEAVPRQFQPLVCRFRQEMLHCVIGGLFLDELHFKSPF